MDLTPETLRSATFRDKLRGYHPDDVDEFLESVARGLEVLLARLRDATERARSSQPPQPQLNPDEAVRTLALAQRTADLAVREAKAEAERLVAAAEERSKRIVSSAEQTATHLAEEAQAELRADLERLQAARDQLFAEVNTLGSWLEGERTRIRRALIDIADRVDGVKETSAPQSKPVSVPAPPRQKSKKRSSSATPPRGQARTAPAEPARPAPPEKPAARERPVDVPRFEPAPLQRAVPPQPPLPPSPTAEGPGRKADPGMSVTTPPADPEDFDDDPYFAELRRAMHDKTPLGPRDDGWGGAGTAAQPPPSGRGS